MFIFWGKKKKMNKNTFDLRNFENYKFSKFDVYFKF